MKYVDKVLDPGETILARGVLHWFIYVRPVLGLIVGTLMMLSGGSVAVVGLGILLIAIVMWLGALIDRSTTEIAVTNRRVIFKRGLIQRSTFEMNANRIESVTVDQPVLGRLFDFGTLIVRGTGTGIEPIKNIAEPLLLRRAVGQVVH
jgi:uncharacterized membrane protein YdbT with pleckstrin-like domain